MIKAISTMVFREFRSYYHQSAEDLLLDSSVMPVVVENALEMRNNLPTRLQTKDLMAKIEQNILAMSVDPKIQSHFQEKVKKFIGQLQERAAPLALKAKFDDF